MQMITIGLILLLSNFALAQDQAFMELIPVKSSSTPQCDDNKSYLFDEMSRLKKSGSLSADLLKTQPFPKLLVKRSCVRAALEQVSAGRDLSAKEKANGGRKKYSANNFVRCEPGKKMMTYQESPCQSHDTVKLTHNSFETVTQCLKDYVSGSKDPAIQDKWIKLYFQMLSKESGLQNYVLSSQNALGAAQITTHYIRDFIQFSMKDTIKHLRKSDHLVCQRLGEELLSDEAFQGFARKKSNGGYSFNSCSFIGAEDNQMLRNFLIGFSNLKVIKDRVRRSAFSSALVKLSPSAQLQVELSFVPLAYNMGNGNLNKTIQNALKGKSQINDASLLIHSVKQAIPFAETKNYQPNINRRFAKVVKDSGQKSCFN